MTEEDAPGEEMVGLLVCELLQLVQLLLRDLLAPELVYQFVVVDFLPTRVHDVVRVHDQLFQLLKYFREMEIPSQAFHLINFIKPFNKIFYY